MKKLLVILILNICILNCVYGETNVVNFVDDPIEDTLILKLPKGLKFNKIYKEDDLIYDDLADKYLDKNLRVNDVKIGVLDDFLVSNLVQNSGKNLNSKTKKDSKPEIEDHLIKYLTKDKVKDNHTLGYFSDDEDIKITPLKYQTTKNGLYEGKYIDFALLNDVTINKKLYKKGTKITGRVENILLNGAYGTPSELVVGNFILTDSNIKIEGSINKRGADRSLWIYPTSTILSPFMGMGLLLLPIRGGHAKLKLGQVYNIGF